MTAHKNTSAIVLRLAAVLLFLVLITTSIVAGRYARYTSTVSGSDSARVAIFNITGDDMYTSFFSVDMKPGDSLSKNIVVMNDTEVAVRYNITVESMDNQLPLEFVYTESGVLHPGNDSNVAALVISWPENANSAVYSGKVDLLRITVEAIQVD